MKVNYRRGLFRLWMVFTIAWVGYFGWLGVTSYREAASLRELAQRLWEERDELSAQAKALDPNSAMGESQYRRLHAEAESLRDEGMRYGKWAMNRDDDLEFAYIYGPTVPLLLLLLFPIGSFVVRGFSAERSKDADSANKLVGKTAQLDANVVYEEQPPSSEVVLQSSVNPLAPGIYCPPCGKNTVHDGQYCSICGRSRGMAEKLASAKKNERRNNVRRIWMTAAGLVLIIVVLATLYSSSPADFSRASRRGSDAFVGTFGVLLVTATLGLVLYLVVIALRRIYRYFRDRQAKT